MKHVALLSLALVVACSSAQLPSSPSPNAAPIPAVSNVAGNWSGTYTITGCEGQRHCAQSLGSRQPFHARLVQIGDSITGVMLGIDVTGTMMASGELTVRGLTPTPSPYLPTRELLRFTGRADATQGLVGAFEYQLTYPPTADVGALSSHVQRIAGEIVSTTYGPVTGPSQFDGTWSGTILFSECTAVGWRDCFPYEPHRPSSVRFTLRQHGNAIDGVVDLGPDIPVTGSVVGDRLTLEGATTESGSIIRITSWSATRDVVGRLSGSFSFVWDAGLLGSPPTPHSSHYHAELVSVILQP